MVLLYFLPFTLAVPQQAKIDHRIVIVDSNRAEENRSPPKGLCILPPELDHSGKGLMYGTIILEVSVHVDTCAQGISSLRRLRYSRPLHRLSPFD